MKKKIQRRTPGNRTVTHEKSKKTSKHRCAICYGLLHGKPRGKTVKIRKTKKSQRRPTRPFGGMLCSKCSRKIMSIRAQLKGKIIAKDDVPISLRGFV